MFQETNKVIKENYYDEYMDELDVFDQDFSEPLSDEQFEFGDALFDFLQSLVDKELEEHKKNLFSHNGSSFF